MDGGTNRLAMCGMRAASTGSAAPLRCQAEAAANMPTTTVLERKLTAPRLDSTDSIRRATNSNERHLHAPEANMAPDMLMNLAKC